MATSKPFCLAWLDPFEGLPANETPLCNDLHEVIVIWRPYARGTAVGLWGVVVVLFGGITTGVVEEKHALWQVCVAVMILSLMGAIASSVVVYHDMRRRAAESDQGQSVCPAGPDGDLGDVEMPLMASSY